MGHSRLSGPAETWQDREGLAGGPDVFQNCSIATAALLAAYAGSACYAPLDDTARAASGGVGWFVATGGSAGGGAAGSAGVSVESCDTSLLLPGCTASTQSATMRTANMLIVLDKSGSMGKPGLGSATSKWDAMKTALNTALNRSRTHHQLRARPVPEGGRAVHCTGDACCQTPALADPLTVPVGPGVETVPRSSAALDATAPGGGTPMAGALSRALDYYTTGDGFNLPGDKYVLLVTDGGPNCHVAAVPSCDDDHVYAEPGSGSHLQSVPQLLQHRGAGRQLPRRRIGHHGHQQPESSERHYHRGRHSGQ